jgi:hypothetical protein
VLPILLLVLSNSISAGACVFKSSLLLTSLSHVHISISISERGEDQDVDPDPAIFLIDLQDANKKKLIYLSKSFFCLLLVEGAFTSFSKIKSKKKSQSSWSQGFFFLFFAW